MVRSDDHRCWREWLARKEALNVVDAAAPDELAIVSGRAGGVWCDDHVVAAEQR